jgi:hypothetical protein
MDILLEGKKEIIEKTKKKHSTDGEFIDKMFAIDPTSQGKYAEWIGKYLDSSLKFKDYDKIEEMINKIVIPFEKNYKKIDDKIVEQFLNRLIESGVKLEGQNLTDVEKIKKDPRDINAYPIPFYILTMLQVLGEIKNKSEEEREAKKSVKVIYKDENVLVVKPLTHKASCYYGYETRWCTASKDSDSNFNRYTSKGVLYYFIPKNNPRGKVALFIEKDGNKITNKEVYDSADEEKGVNLLYERFPELTNLINELVGELPIVDLLKSYKTGKIDSDELLSSDSFIGILKNEKDKGETIVKFGFNGLDDYKKLFDLSDDDIWFLNVVDDPYNTYDFYSMDIDYEWKDGYIIQRFNDENKALLREILKYILPKYADADLDSPETAVINEITKYLDDMFKSEVSNITSEFQTEMNRAARIGAEYTIEKELCDYFKQYGIEKSSDRCYYLYQTTINNLIKLFEKYQPKNDTIRTLLKTIAEDDNVGGWAYSGYEMIEWDAFDEEGFQREVNRNLEKMKEDIEENENYVGPYKEIYDEITKNYKFEEWYKLPRNKEYDFRINRIDVDDLTISVTTRKGYGNYKQYILNDIDEFYSFLYNYKLFDDYQESDLTK